MTHARTRLFPVVLALALTALFALALTGCGANDDQEVRAVLDENLTINDDDLQQITDTLNQETVLDAYHVKLGDYVGTLLKGYSYNIDSIQVAGSSATATVSVTAQDFSTSLDTFAKSMTDNAKELKKLQKAKETKRLRETVDGYLTDALNKAGNSTSSTSITVQLQKSDGEWKLSDESGFKSDLNGAMFGKTIQRLKDALQ